MILGIIGDWNVISPTILSRRSYGSRTVAPSGGNSGVFSLLLVFVVLLCACLYAASAECALGTETSDN